MNTGRQFLNESSRFLTDVFFPKIERTLEQLSDDDIWWRPNEASNSIGNLILHLSGNVRQWIISGLGGQEDKRTRQQEFDERSKIPKAELISRLRTTVEEAVGVLNQLDPSLLSERRVIQKKEVSLLYAVYHAVEHFSMHTGQIISFAKLRSGKDLKFYEMKDGLPVELWRKEKPSP